MGEGNKVASVILFTFTLKPHAHKACLKPPPPGCGWLAKPAKAVVGLFEGVDELTDYVKTTYICTTLCHQSQLHHS